METLFKILIGVLGIFVPIVWNRFNTKREMEIQILSSISMFENAQDGPSLGLSFHGREIPSLTKSEIAIVNTGRAEITRDDVLSPMALQFPTSAELLHVAVTGGSPEGRQAKAEIVKPGEAIVTFPLLNSGGAIRLSAYLTGAVAVPREVKAAIKGIKRLPIIDKTRQPIVRTASIGWTTAAVAIFTLFFLSLVPEEVRQTHLQLEARERLAHENNFLDAMSLEQLKEYADEQMVFTSPTEQEQLNQNLTRAPSREAKEQAYRDWIRFYITDLGAATATLIFSLIVASIGATYVGIRVRRFLAWRRTQAQ